MLLYLFIQMLCFYILYFKMHSLFIDIQYYIITTKFHFLFSIAKIIWYKFYTSIISSLDWFRKYNYLNWIGNWIEFRFSQWLGTNVGPYGATDLAACKWLKKMIPSLSNRKYRSVYLQQSNCFKIQQNFVMRHRSSKLFWGAEG